MLSKDKLRVDFSKEPNRYYSTKLFEREGFERKQCTKCGKYFWTTDKERETCGDPSHEPYSFIKKKPTSIGYEEFWNKFSAFFKRNKHAIIEKYPVVSRWRPDLYFTIASIQDFQRIENGKMSFEYSDNPLLVPQMCMRFTDIPNVGVTGRHLTSFMMAGQHAFDYPKKGYWRDRCIDLNYELLTKIADVKKETISYIEDVWAMGDFSEFGPCLEFFSKGAELGNNVFTEFEYHDNKIKELPGKVVDVGWGFERLLWYYTGAQTIYDAVFPKELEYIYRNSTFKHDHSLYAKIASLSGAIDVTEAEEKDAEQMLIKRANISPKDYHTIIRPMQAAYAIADHTRALLFAIHDGALPSNMGGGYNLRIILRRVFDFMDRYDMKVDLLKLMEMHANDVKNLYKGLADSMPEINEIISLERSRYESTKQSATKIVNTIIEKKEELTPEMVRTLYESNGITPEFISSSAKAKGITLDLPEELYTKMIKGDFARKEAKHESSMPVSTEGIKKTGKLYYEFATESRSKVLLCEANYVVLDKTPFYPESGGQENDTGTIGGVPIKRVDVINNVVIHEMEGKPTFKKGSTVECKVNVERRIRLMAHHTATHLINASARTVLGQHAWQEGAKKGPGKAHIDIAHYEKLSDKQVSDIENTANSFILHGMKVKMEVMDRSDAEKMYGFSIYQGHGVPAKELRIVTIRDLDGNLIDAQACGGLHLMNRETLIGLIKIISTSRPHDGVDRIEFVAGLAALDKINSMEDTLRNISKASSLDLDKLNQGITDRMDELQRTRRESKKLSEELGHYMTAALDKDAKDAIKMELEYGRQTLREIATRMIEDHEGIIVLLYNKAGDAVCIAGTRSGKSAVDLLKEFAAKSGKKLTGGGSDRIAEGSMG